MDRGMIEMIVHEWRECADHSSGAQKLSPTHSDPSLPNSLSKWQRLGTIRGSKSLEVGKTVRQNRIDNANVAPRDCYQVSSIRVIWVKHWLEWIIGVDQWIGVILDWFCTDLLCRPRIIWWRFVTSNLKHWALIGSEVDREVLIRSVSMPDGGAKH